MAPCNCLCLDILPTPCSLKEHVLAFPGSLPNHTGQVRCSHSSQMSIYFLASPRRLWIPCGLEQHLIHPCISLPSRATSTQEILNKTFDKWKLTVCPTLHRHCGIWTKESPYLDVLFITLGLCSQYNTLNSTKLKVTYLCEGGMICLSLLFSSFSVICF